MQRAARDFTSDTVPEVTGEAWNGGCFTGFSMAYPVPIVACDCCEHRFILDPGAMVEDVALEFVQLLCRMCRPEDEAEGG